MCELRVTGFDYVGAGNSTNKKDAQANASRDFINYLVRTGHVNEKDVPGDLPASSSTPATPIKELPIPNTPMRSVFEDGMGPDDIGQAYRPYNNRGQSNYTYIDRIAEQKNVEEAEDVDVNAGIHGNWTIEMLNQNYTNLCSQIKSILIINIHQLVLITLGTIFM